MKIKRCPFCGGEAEAHPNMPLCVESGKQSKEIMWFTWCTECSALVVGATKEDAIAEWNRRYDD